MPKEKVNYGNLFYLAKKQTKNHDAIDNKNKIVLKKLFRIKIKLKI